MGLMDAVTTISETQPTVEVLYRTDGERLWRAVLAFAGDPEIASDAVNEAFAQLIRRGDGPRDPAAWVWRTAFVIARGMLHDRRSDERSFAPDGFPESALVAEPDRRPGPDPDILAALRQLPEGQRAALILFYYADLPIRQIADRLSMNSLLVRANLSRGRRRLRILLGDDDD